MHSVLKFDATKSVVGDTVFTCEKSSILCVNSEKQITSYVATLSLWILFSKQDVQGGMYLFQHFNNLEQKRLKFF